MNEKLFTTKQAAEKLGITQELVTRLIRAGRIQAVMVGRDWLMAPAALEDYQRAPKHKRGRPRKEQSAPGQS